jgi:hypothetical protein
MNYPTPASGAAQDRLCELMDICRPHVHIGLEVRAELRRALLELYHLRGASQPSPQPAGEALGPVVHPDIPLMLADIVQHSHDDFARHMAEQSLKLLPRSTGPAPAAAALTPQLREAMRVGAWAARELGYVERADTLEAAAGGDDNV